MRSINRVVRLRPVSWGAMAAVILLAGAGPDDEKKALKVVPAAEAKDHVGETCTVEMIIRSSKNAVPRRTYYLDSEEDFHADTNCAVVISYDHIEAFQKAGVLDPAEHYKGKKLRVTGKIIHEDDQTRIRVEDPEKIVIVDDDK